MALTPQLKRSLRIVAALWLMFVSLAVSLSAQELPPPSPQTEKEPQPPPLKTEEAEKSPTFKAVWKDGLYFERDDKKFRFSVGGRLQVDGVGVIAPDRVMFGPNGVGRIDDAVNFRRARLDVLATIYGNIDFYVQYDFLNTFVTQTGTDPPRVANVPAPTDLWMTFKELPYVGNLRVGNQKPPISFEHMTSSRFLMFLERSLAFDAFVEDQDNGFRPGIQMFNWAADERKTWALGVFKNNRNAFGWNTGDGEYDITGRLTCLPVYECGGERLIHLGVGASHRDLDDDQARFRSRLLIRNGPAVLHTILAQALMLGDSQDLVVPEFVAVCGPFSMQAEYYATWVQNAVAPVFPVADRVNHGTAFFQGCYVDAAYFLTGEHREYDPKYPAFKRVTPRTNATWGGECRDPVRGGAWQVAARYSFLDLNSPGIEGGILHDLTVGLNWFLNPNTKLQWNYSLVYRDGPGEGSDGFVHAIGTRLAWDF